MDSNNTKNVTKNELLFNLFRPLSNAYEYLFSLCTCKLLYTINTKRVYLGLKSSTISYFILILTASDKIQCIMSEAVRQGVIQPTILYLAEDTLALKQP